MLPRYQPAATQTDIVTFIYLNQAALQGTLEDDEAIKEEQPYLEHELISQDREIPRDSMCEDQLQALDEA
jgi:hypothetical protein